MGFVRKGVAIATGIVIAAAQLLAFAAPASAYGSVTLGSGSASNTFTAPTAPVTPSISGGQPFAFQYPGGVFELGAPTNGSTTITVNAYKNGALDTTFNTTGSVSFTSQLATGNRSWLEMTTYANGSKWAILDSNSSTNSGYNFLYLGTFAGGYQSTVTLPTTASNYNTCTTKLNSVSNGTYTSYSGSFRLVPNTGFATPVISIDCSIFLNSAGASFTSTGKFLVQYSGGTTIGTPATLNPFTTGGTFANGYQAIGASSSKTLTSFGMSVNPNATGSQVALTYVDGLSTDTSYTNPTAYDTTPYGNFVITRITAAGDVSFTLSAFTGISVGSRTGTVVVPPRNNGTIYALQHATDGTTATAKVLTIGSTGVATATTVTGVNLTSSVNRIAPQTSPGSTIKLASLNNGSPSYYYHLNGSTAVMTQVSTFTTSGGFSYPELLWGMADNSDGSDFYARSSSTGIIRVATTTAPQAPTAPATPTVVRGDGQVAVTWVAPANGGAAITGYTLDYSSNSGSTWTNWSSAISSSATTETVTGLTNGTAYVFRVAATNSVGTSAWSSSSASVSAAALPGAPTLSTLTPGANSVALVWSAPSSNGGFAITDYTIEYSSNSGSTWVAFSHTASNATSITVTGLTNGINYVFRVTAITSIGAGSASATSAAQLVAAAPGQLNAPTIANGNTQATVTWVAPASNGCPITAYRVDYSSNSGSTWNIFTSSVAGTSQVVTGLSNGTSYVFRVAASNCMGFGAASVASSAVTPNQTPNSVSGLSVVGAGSSTVTLSWSAVVSTPAVTDYLIEYSTDGGATWVTFNDANSAATTATVTGLTVGQNYSFRVTAINSIGQGSSSSATSSIAAATVPTTIAAAPTLAASPGQVALSWLVPNNGGSSLTSAEIQYSINGGASWLTFSGAVDLSGTAQIVGLTGGQAYVFRARTSNFFGASAWSAASSSVTFLAATAPGTIGNVTSNPGATAGSVDLSWSAPAANGSPITDYQVEYSSDGGTTWTTFVHTASNSTSMTVTGLTSGTQYQFRVKAINAIGNATASANTTPVAAAAAPAGGAISETTAFIGALKTGAKAEVVDGKLTISGENMNLVSKILMNAIEAPITFRTAITITVSVPATVIGWVDVEFVMASSSIRFQDFVYVANTTSKISRLGIGYQTTSGKKVSTSTLKNNAVVRLAATTPKFKDAKTATCIGYVVKGSSQRDALARARHTCEQISLRYPNVAVKLATTKSNLRAHVLVLFNY